MQPRNYIIRDLERTDADSYYSFTFMTTLLDLDNWLATHTLNETKLLMGIERQKEDKVWQIFTLTLSPAFAWDDRSAAWAVAYFERDFCYKYNSHNFMMAFAYIPFFYVLRHVYRIFWAIQFQIRPQVNNDV